MGFDPRMGLDRFQGGCNICIYIYKKRKGIGTGRMYVSREKRECFGLRIEEESEVIRWLKKRECR